MTTEAKEPFEGALFAVLQVAGDEHEGHHDGAGDSQAQGYESGDGERTFGEEELFGEYKAYAPEKDAGGDDEIWEEFFQSVKLKVLSVE